MSNASKESRKAPRYAAEKITNKVIDRGGILGTDSTGEEDFWSDKGNVHFRPFPRLPPEIRNTIWEIIICQPRDIRILEYNDHHKERRSCSGFHWKIDSHSYPALLVVTRESRAVAKAHLGQNLLMMNFDHDVLRIENEVTFRDFFDPIACGSTFRRTNSLSPVAYAHLRHLVVSIDCIALLFGRIWKGRFLSLETITLTSMDRHQRLFFDTDGIVEFIDGMKAAWHRVTKRDLREFPKFIFVLGEFYFDSWLKMRDDVPPVTKTKKMFLDCHPDRSKMVENANPLRPLPHEV